MGGGSSQSWNLSRVSTITLMRCSQEFTGLPAPDSETSVISADQALTGAAHKARERCVEERRDLGRVGKGPAM